MPRLAQQILTRANIQIVEEKTDQNTSIHRSTRFESSLIPRL